MRQPRMRGALGETGDFSLRVIAFVTPRGSLAMARNTALLSALVFNCLLISAVAHQAAARDRGDIGPAWRVPLPVAPTPAARPFTRPVAAEFPPMPLPAPMTLSASVRRVS